MRTMPILAENYRIFRRFIEEHNLNVGHFAYIQTSDNIRGHRGVILAIGRWWINDAYNSDFHYDLEQRARTGQVSVVKGIWRH